MSNERLLKEIRTRMAFQLRWRRIMSVSYFTGASVALFCSTAATVTSGIGYGVATTVFAGAATLLFGLEKLLLLREKWAHHRTIAAQLDALMLEYEFGALSDDEAARRAGHIMKEYAVTTPTPARDADKTGA
jgi:hypothetical protein